ncbi:protein jagged-1a-like [Bolinopsis microptera]|uniref:protein jagged-1a-like n=1 Tax=Bolinopsis microptera TaxID=2820187 RepID=UPI00307A9288
MMRIVLFLTTLLPGLIQAGHICDIPGICPTGYTCVPDTPYSGNCVADSVCQEDTCPEGEVCEENEDKTHTCMCPPGTERSETNCVEFCDLPNACLDPLMECIPTDTSYNCVCPENYLVQNGLCLPGCQTEVCPEKMDCLLELNNTISCLCGEGEVVGGKDCVPACKSDSCPDHMECETDTDSFKCLCPAGFILTAEEQCVPECEVEPCEEEDSCVAHEGVYQCCPEGHLPHPDTRECTPTCLIPNICPAGLECLNHKHENASFSCICPDHSVFNADGECVDFCEVEFCPSGMECSATEGGFNCTCSESEECKQCSDNPCDQDFICVQGDFTHQCICDEGYQLKHGRCVDMNECEYDICNISGAECTNMEGSYQCTCPRNSYYNDTSNACDRYNMCDVDPCETSKTGMSCRDLGVGFACLCPEDYPEDLCAEQEPCDCGENEECVEADGKYFCQCDKSSFKPISYGAQACIPDPEVKNAGIINPKKGVTFTLRLGETDKISLKLKDSDRDRRSPWHLVSWYKADRGLKITGGRATTPAGHFSTPHYRQQVVLQNIRPEDRGLYMVRIEKPGYRTVSDKVTVKIEDPITANYGPKNIKGGNYWGFKVHLNAKLEDYKITWYRDIAGHLELLQDDGDSVKYEQAGRQLTVEKKAGVYLARLRGTLPGPSGTLVTGEVKFPADK